MLALVKYAVGPGNIELREVPEPLVRPGHVVVQVAAAGVCGTDLHIQAGEYPIIPPVVLGHEFSGTVVEAAPDGNQALKGRRVTCTTHFSTCGECEFCRTDQPNLCPRRKALGAGADGAFARYVLVPERNVWPLPENVDLLAGAVTEPLACCTHAVIEKATIKPSQVVLVLGPGAIGLLAAQVALACGGTVLVAGTDRDAERLELARRLGVSRAVNVSAESLPDVVGELTGGRGADVVIECSGSSTAVRAGCELAKRRGQFVQIGLFGKRIEWDPDLAVMKEIHIRTSFGSTPASWGYALKLMEQGRVQTGPLVTHTLPLEEWERGFEIARRQMGLKLLLMPG